LFPRPTHQISGPPSPLPFTQSCGSTPHRRWLPRLTGPHYRHCAPPLDSPHHRQSYSVRSRLLGIARCDFLSQLMLALASLPLLVARATANRRATVRAPCTVTTAWSHCGPPRERAGSAGFSSWAVRPLEYLFTKIYAILNTESLHAC
jgi:hypothetical protein